MLSHGTADLQLHAGQGVVFDSRAPYRVLVSGRRWGKTELCKAETLCEMGTPGTLWYIAPTYDMARELMWEPLRAIVPRHWLTRDPNESRMEMLTHWGCRVSCKSAEHPDRLRGRGLRKAIMDEFQDWRDGLSIWEEVIQPMLLTTHGTALFTGTPKHFNHLYQLYARGQSTEPRWNSWASWQFRTADAPHIPQDLLHDMREQMDPRAYRQEFEASFEALSGRAYYAFNRHDHVKAVTLEQGVPVVVTFDFNIQPATAVICQRVGDEARVWREVWITSAGGEATRAAATRVRDMLAEVGYRGPVQVYGDPAGRAGKTTGPSDHAVLREVFHGATFYIPKVAPHVKDRVASVNARCQTASGEARLVIDPSCEHLIGDLEQVVYTDAGDLDKRSNPMLTHISDALGYWIHQAWPPVTRGGVAVGFSSWL
jgi:hypothetical protein